jgi:hypothetical protein
MAEQDDNLSVRERIEGRLLEVLQAASATWCTEDVTAGRMSQAQADKVVVERWDARGNRAGHMDTIIEPVQETVDDGSNGDIGTTNKTLDVYVTTYIAQADGSDSLPSSLGNRQMARIEKAVMAHAPNLPDSGGELLTIDINVTNAGFVENSVEDQPEYVVGVKFTFQYRHPRNDPFTVSG